MIENVIYLTLAILGLGFLIFIHELGHYLVARKVGMTVEVFSIGFGKPFKSWVVSGVKWQLCYLPFGGYVRIAGMEKKGGLEPHQIADGFFGKGPGARIKVALAGPCVNILFALIAFTVIWITGGQVKPFQHYTDVIGMIDPSSKLYESGVRAGDQITSVGSKKIQGFQDLMIQLALNGKSGTLSGSQIDYLTAQEKPFIFSLDSHISGLQQLGTLGIAPAQYLIFEEFVSPASPLEKSGIKKGDRILWVDGSCVFSKEHLVQLLNEPFALLTIERGGKREIVRVPRLKTSEFALSSNQRAELGDWQSEAKLSGKLSQLYFIPYNLSTKGVVESQISYLDDKTEEKFHPPGHRNSFDAPLQPGDKIVGLWNEPISSAFELLSKLQVKKSVIVTQRAKAMPTPSWKQADPAFVTSFEGPELTALIQKIGQAGSASSQGDLTLLQPVTLKSFSELPLDAKTKTQTARYFEARQKQIEKIANTQEREQKFKELRVEQNRYMLGIALQDRQVIYNPSPLVLFTDVLEQTYRTLTSLFSGSLSPKNLSGPVGIVQALQYSWATGVKNALYWLGFVSLNLAILNLFPIPVLDGGHILFALIEKATKKPIKAKTMENLIIPFVVLMVIFFIYVTYQDLVRLITSLLR